MKIIKRIVVFLLVLIVLVVSVYLARNIIATKILEKQLSIANGAKVDIRGFKNKFLSADIYIEKVEVGNRGDYEKNLIEMENINFDISIKPLFAKKILIEDMSIGLVREETERKESGKLPDNWLKKDKVEEEGKKEENKLVEEVKKYVNDKIEEEKNKIALINLEGANNEDKVKEVVSLLQLELEKEYLESKEYLEERSKYWQDKVENNTYKEELKNIEEKAKNINYDFEKIKNIKDIEGLKREKEILEKKVDEIKNLLNQSKIIVEKVKNDKLEVEEEIKNLDKLKDEFLEAANNDYDKIKNIVNLDSKTLVGLSIQLLGENLTKYVVYAFEQYKKITILQKEEKVKKVKKDKMPHLPKIWIKNISLTFENHLGIFSGGIKDISSNQQLSKKPFEIFLNQKNKASINYIYDNREKLNKNQIEFYWDNIKFKSKYVNSESVRVDGNYIVEKGRIFGESNILLRKFDLIEEEIFTKERYREVLRDLSKKIDEGRIETKINFTEGKREFNFWSNIDKELLNAIEDMLGREIERLKEKVEEKAKEEMDRYKDKVAFKIKEEGEKLGVVIDEELLHAIKNLENLESLEKLIKSQEGFVKGEIERILNEKFLEEKNKIIDKLKIESRKIGIEILPIEYESMNKAKNIEELEHISKEVWKRVEEEKKKEVEEKAKEEIEKERKKLEKKGKEELNRLKDKFF